ncbi:hypothetical protein FA15DRAFT_674817 [Coprinopsis marcescibilis]|uniref:Uncharacterized protein n=1 Tax=Coprinopsis marcescibilis TaxID=230819 RepID=A0A5C3KFT9_COPMA|nr:hypothetical protein FA15DRAFT_674817 [Coprinopsis marcescibilis]
MVTDTEKHPPASGIASLYTPNVGSNTCRRASAVLSLLYTSLITAVVVFSLSLSHLGTLTFFLAPIVGALTWTFTLTLVVFTHKDLKALKRGTHKNDKNLMAMCRLPSIVVPFILMVPWVVTLILLVFNLSFLGALYRTPTGAEIISDERWGRSGYTAIFRNIVRPILERDDAKEYLGQIIGVGSSQASLVGLQCILMPLIGFLSTLERKAKLRDLRLGRS